MKRQMKRNLVYVECERDGNEMVYYYDIAKYRVCGGVKALEAAISEDCRWYSRIGELKLRTTRAIRFPSAAVRVLLESWIERGAPTTAGAAGTGKPESTAFAPRYFFYKHCDATGLEDLSFLSEAEVLKHGGVESLEATISNDTSWFYPIGSLLVPEWAVKPDGLAIPERRVRALVNAWLKQGSPWKPGKFARDLDAPPKGHPYRRRTAKEKRDKSRIQAA